jgi:hypothetical protein
MFDDLTAGRAKERNRILFRDTMTQPGAELLLRFHRKVLTAHVRR